jgi:hypothetical protein
VVGRNRVLVVSARCGRAVWRYVLRGLIEAGKSMAPYGPGAIAELYEPGYDGHHPDRWTARLTLRERRLWRALEHRLRRADPAPPPPAPPAAAPETGWQAASDQHQPPR